MATNENIAVEIVISSADYQQDTPTQSAESQPSSSTEQPPQPVQSTLTPPSAVGDEPGHHATATSLHMLTQLAIGTEKKGYDPDKRFKNYLRSLKDCTNKQEGFDVYQLLAFRRMQHKLEPYAPPPPGCYGKLAKTFKNKYYQAIAMVLVIGLLQTFGVTLILTEVVLVYFFPQWYDIAPEDAADFECEIGAESWDEPGEVMYKVLAFLFATMISINLGKAIHTIKTNGFNSVLDYHRDDEDSPAGLKHAHYHRVQVADIALIQVGVLINMYALLLAVFGSFFMIYASEDGADSLDMVFNALALFFLIELDDLLVQDDDYEDVKKFLYDNENKLWKMKHVDSSKADSVAVQCCKPSCLKRFKAFSDALQYGLVLIVHVAAVIGPFAVSLCW